MKIIDIDEIFENSLKEYIKNNSDMREEELEDKIVSLYAEFENKKLDELNGETPVSYFEKMSSEEKVLSLKEYVLKKVSVPDFLCEAIERDENSKSYLLALLDEKDEELISYAINMLKNYVDESVLTKCFELLLCVKTKAEIKDILAELLGENADAIKSKIILEYEKRNDLQGYFVDILSNCQKDDGVYSILIDNFLRSDDLLLSCAYLKKYGDERALKFLYTEIEREDLNYAEFKELKFTIEALGGQYDKVRDFTNDKYYKKLHDI